MPITNLAPNRDMTWESFNKFSDMFMQEKQFQQANKQMDRQYQLELQKLIIDKSDLEARTKYTETQAALMAAQKKALDRQNAVYEANPDLPRREIEAGIKLTEAKAEYEKLQESVRLMQTENQQLRTVLATEQYRLNQQSQFNEQLQRDPFIPPSERANFSRRFGEVSRITDPNEQQVAREKLYTDYQTISEQGRQRYTESVEYKNEVYQKLRSSEPEATSVLDARIGNGVEQVLMSDPNASRNLSAYARYTAAMKKQKIFDTKTTDDSQFYNKDVHKYLLSTGGTVTDDDFGGFPNPIRRAKIRNKRVYIDVNTAMEATEKGKMSTDEFKNTFGMYPEQARKLQENYINGLNNPYTFVNTNGSNKTPNEIKADTIRGSNRPVDVNEPNLMRGINKGFWDSGNSDIDIILRQANTGQYGTRTPVVY